MQKTFDLDYERFVTEYEASQKRRRYEEADHQIFNKVINYERENILEYFRGLSHNYEMN